jgi:hypothetical protein
MASARSATPPRRTSQSRSPKRGNPDHEVSPARWAGVAFVIAAIVSAIALAFISPSQPGAAQQPAAVAAVESPSPAPSALAQITQVPTVQPKITNPPPDETTPEREISVTVEIPEEADVPRRLLTLSILLDGEVEQEVDRPETGGSITVDGVRIEPGPNTLQAVLSTLAGPGPVSEPVTVTLDPEQTKLAIIAPEKKSETYAEQVDVEVAAEPDTIVNVAKVNSTQGQNVTLGPTGQATVTVRLKKGNNRIRARTVDSAGQAQTARITVRRIDGTPKIKVQAPAKVERSSLPAKVKVSVRVTDAEGKPLEGATLNYSLGGSGRIAQTDVDTTNANGRATWNTTISPTSSPSGDEVTVTVTATSPESGEPATVDRAISLD